MAPSGMERKRKEKSIKLAVDRLVPGLYIDLELSWKQHPFLFSRFKLKSESEIQIIRQLGLSEVSVFPERSEAQVPTLDDAPTQSTDTSKDQLWADKRERIEEAARYRRRRDNVSHKYKETVKKVKRLNQDLKTAPANAMRDAGEVIENMIETFDTQSQVLINLVNLSDAGFTFYNHALNVTVLSLMLGRALGLSTDELRDLGLGAMLHDVGKTLIPSKVLMKRGEFTRAEVELIKTHTVLGARLARQVQKLRPEAIAVIEQHHEMLDGSGYPEGLKGDAQSRYAKIVAITNIYDKLCNPDNPADALPPKAVMAILYAKYKNKLDTELVQRLITILGIYPPGTVVRLSDDSIGLVTAVDSKALLKPHILLYNPDIPRNEALSIDLTEHPELSISDVLKPGDYDQRIYDYLGIQERIGYFYENLSQ